MFTHTTLLRTFSLSLLFTGSIALATTATPTPDDEAARLLATQGSITVKEAGRFVETGTFRIQVAHKLGRPDLTLTDGTWLYHHRRIGTSNAVGTLVVRFVQGRVSSLSLVTPAVVAAMRAESGQRATQFVAAK